MDNKPLINILTRTSNRPKYFKHCINSIREQTYDNIRHIVSVDDDITEKYVKEYDVEYIRVTRNDDIEKSPYPNRKIAPYNLYLNDLKFSINDGWILYLDDDDEFISPNSIQDIVNDIIKSGCELLLWRVKFPNSIIPEDIFFNRRMIAPCHISMIGFIYNSKLDRDTFFDGYTLGDYTFISKLVPLTHKIKWIDKIYTGIQRVRSMGGYGRRDDK